MDFVTRFAPSPTGRLHLGHAFSALTAFDAAKAAGGRFLLRIEDIDRGRCRPEFEAAILEDLAWLGVRWEEPVRRQSDHLGDYARTLDRLIGSGVMYRCFKTRREIAEESDRAPHGIGDVYRGPETPLSSDAEAKLLAAGESFAWRLSMIRAREALGARWEALAFVADGDTVKADPALLGDVVLARKDAATSYHLASVHDDAVQGVSHVIRGVDLEASTHVHRLLQELLELPVPAYSHHRLILSEDGRRLAKRNRAATVQALRESGENPAGVREMLGL